MPCLSLVTAIRTPSGPAATRTAAAAPPACLTTLVSASWMMRYTVSAAAGGSAATSPVTARLTGVPGRPHHPGQFTEVGDARRRRQARPLRVVVAEQAEDAAQFLERAPPGDLNGPQRAQRLGRGRPPRSGGPPQPGR